MAVLSSLTLSGVMLVSFVTTIVACLVRERRSLRSESVRPYVGEFVPLEKAVQKLEREQLSQSPEARGWPPGFFDRTYGSLADDPIERPSQGDYEVRDEIE